MISYIISYIACDISIRNVRASASPSSRGGVFVDVAMRLSRIQR